MSEGAYSKSGVDQGDADEAVARLVGALGSSDDSRQVLASGHYANVVDVGSGIGIAVTTDGVGSKLVVAEKLGRWDTVGIDCVAMNVNDVICVGARPLAMVDYLAVEAADPEIAEQIGIGLGRGASLGDVEIVGGELAQLGELINGLDLAGACFGIVEVERMVTGSWIEPGDSIIGLPSSGLHSNGYTLARKALEAVSFEDDRLGRPLGEVLLEPTTIYSRAIVGLLDSGLASEVHGLAHITSGGLENLLRLDADVAFEIDDPLPVPPIFSLIAELGEVEAAEMRSVFNMGCGFCCVVASEVADAVVEALQGPHPGTRRIGSVVEGPAAVVVV